jgi:long-chain acyl-CoA synthetase
MKYPQELSLKMAQARQSSKKLDPIPYMGIADLLKEREQDEKPWIIWYDVDSNRSQLNYREFVSLVKQCAAYLEAQGLGRGSRIATVSHNHWHTVVHYFAAWMIGATVVPINLGEDDDRIAFILRFAEVSSAFVRDTYQDRWETILSAHLSDQNIQSFVCTETHPGFSSDQYEKEIETLNTLNEGSLIVFTSGTTGNPKAVYLTQEIMLHDARYIMEWHRVGWDDRLMCVLPIHHVNGTILTLLTPFYTGSSTVLNQKFQTEHFFNRIAKEQVRTVSVVPTLLQFLMQHHADGLNMSIPHFKYIICSAGPLTVSTAQQFTERFGIRIIHGYGLSETT